MCKKLCCEFSTYYSGDLLAKNVHKGPLRLELSQIKSDMFKFRVNLVTFSHRFPPFLAVQNSSMVTLSLTDSLNDSGSDP